MNKKTTVDRSRTSVATKSIEHHGGMVIEHFRTLGGLVAANFPSLSVENRASVLFSFRQLLNTPKDYSLLDTDVHLQLPLDFLVPVPSNTGTNSHTWEFCSKNNQISGN